MPAKAQTQSAAAESVKPGINAPYLDPEMDVEDWVARFEVESREVFRAREEIVALLGLSPGDRVADVGAGTGAFLETFSRAVGEPGRVYAVDISPRFIERLNGLAERLELRNVTTVHCGQTDVMLPRESVDAVFVCDVYHHFEFPPASLRSIRDALRTGGELLVVDFERIPGVSAEWIFDHVRAGKEVFRAEIERAGFEFVEEPDLESLEENYVLRFRRP